MFYSEFRFYSPIFDADCLRISSSDPRGGEHFVIFPAPAMGKSVRELRDRAILAIEAAIESELDPGEIKLQGGFDG